MRGRHRARRLLPVLMALGFLLSQAGAATATGGGNVARVEPFRCGVIFGGTEVVPTNSKVIIFGGWFAKTKLQVLAFALAVKWTLKVNGKSVFVPRYYKPLERLEGGDWFLPFEYPAGKLRANQSMDVVFDVVLRFPVYDGYDLYPKGSTFGGPVQCAITTVGGGDADGDGAIDAHDNCPAVANPDQSNRYGSEKGDACEDDVDGNGVPDTEQDDVCLSVNGASILAKGSTSCTSTDGGAADLANVATAGGAGSSASAGTGSGNTATASNGATAVASDGMFNYAAADGIGASATARYGEQNGAYAFGDASTAFAGGTPSDPASFNFAIAEGIAASAAATATDGCAAEAFGDGASEICP